MNKPQVIDAQNDTQSMSSLAIDITADGGLSQPVGRSGEQYIEKIIDDFDAGDVTGTTILVSGLTIAQDRFFAASLKGLGYNVQVMDVPDNEALHAGKEFGNRGQCNPTYYTVGNLVKFLTHLRDDKGLTVEEIKQNFVYITAGACGPCRFGTYITEYRKALRDAGFEGFRVLTASQTDGVKQAVGSGDGMVATPKLFLRIVQSLVLGDILNLLMYRIRPYEVESGATDKAIAQCREIVEAAFSKNTSLFSACLKVRKILKSVKVDRSTIKPKVAIIGEFWAMTTEGDGNYKLQAFLESEGAEVDIQPITAWMLYLIWQGQWDMANRQSLKRSDDTRRGLHGVNTFKKALTLKAAKVGLLAMFRLFAKLMGLSHYQFADMDEIANISQQFYDNDNRGGEGHMEVGKLILNAKKSKVNMTVSVKPFGCMPSSGVSDGVQSKITELYPNAIFLPIETTGDGAVNVYSRIQMQLFKAKQQAIGEYERSIENLAISAEKAKKTLQAAQSLQYPLHNAQNGVACTAAALLKNS